MCSGWVGLHAAADTLRDNKWYNDLLGAHFIGHPPLQKGKVTFLSAAFSELDMDVSATWETEDEWLVIHSNIARSKNKQ